VARYSPRMEPIGRECPAVGATRILVAVRGPDWSRCSTAERGEDARRRERVGLAEDSRPLGSASRLIRGDRGENARSRGSYSRMLDFGSAEDICSVR
jgi:hypothetical protein